MDYNWKERNFKRKFVFREIRFKFKKIFIITGQKKSVFINHRIVYFQFNDDSSIDMISKKELSLFEIKRKKIFF